MRYLFNVCNRVFGMNTNIFYPMLAELSVLSGRPEKNTSVHHPYDNHIIIHRYEYVLDDEEIMYIKLKYSEKIFNLYLKQVDTVEQ